MSKLNALASAGASKASARKAAASKRK
jgi:hypothetical protein